MKSFIHTFSMRTKIGMEEFKNLKKAYSKIWSKGERKYILGIYAHKGLRIKIYPCKEIEVRMDKEHKLNKVDIIFTPYKLLHPNCNMGKIENYDDIIEVVKQIIKLLNEIYERSNVDLLKNAKINRVDVTCDVITPSENYSKEIIRIAKKTKLPYGYKVWEPSKEEMEEHPEWKTDNAAFWYNHSREIQCKLYNKKADVNSELECREKFGDAGVVRFELTLKRKFLRQMRYLKTEMEYLNISNILIAIMKDADILIKTYISDILCLGDILSKKVLIKYISRKCGSKKKKYEKILKYIECINQGNIKQYGSDKSIWKMDKYFDDMSISPIYSIGICPYIPSFDKQISGEEIDQKLFMMAKTYNEKRKHFDIIYWR